MFLASDYVSIVMTKNSPILNDINLKKKAQGRHLLMFYYILTKKIKNVTQ